MIKLTNSEQRLADKAIAHVKENAKDLVRELADPGEIEPDTRPVSVFMAGSPGAGKTEFSKRLIDILWEGDSSRVVRIDPDELRERLPDYSGGNAYVFQAAVSVAVEKLHDAALKQEQNFILDGTLSEYGKALNNIKRSLKKNRLVFIFYIYQDPLVAWEFTEKREEKEGRRIEQEVFVDQFFAAQDSVNKLKETMGKKVSIHLVEKDFKHQIVQFKANIDRVDRYVKCPYTDKKSLIEALENL